MKKRMILMNYTTQMDAGKKGITANQTKLVAKKEWDNKISILREYN